MDHLVLINQIRDLEDRIDRLAQSSDPEDQQKTRELLGVLEWRVHQIEAMKRRRAKRQAPVYPIPDDAA